MSNSKESEAVAEKSKYVRFLCNYIMGDSLRLSTVLSTFWLFFLYGQCEKLPNLRICSCASSVFDSLNGPLYRHLLVMFLSQ